jgi:hypothetical protein
MNDLLLTGLVVSAAGLWLSLLTLPRWFVRSMHRHRMWRHRDEIVDEILDGRLPDHPAVWELLNDAERSIHLTDRVTYLRGYMACRSIGTLSPQATARWNDRTRPSSLEGLSATECELLRNHRIHDHQLTVGVVLLGSWVGFFVVLGRFAALLRDEHRERRLSRRAFALATDDAVVHTRLGQSAGRSVSASLDMDRAIAV